MPRASESSSSERCRIAHKRKVLGAGHRAAGHQQGERAKHNKYEGEILSDRRRRRRRREEVEEEEEGRRGLGRKRGGGP